MPDTSGKPSPNDAVSDKFVKIIRIHDLTALFSRLSLTVPILFRLALHRRRCRVLDLEPIVDPAGCVGELCGRLGDEIDQAAW